MKKLSIYIIIVLGLLFSSCEKTLKTPKTHAKPLIVINSVLEANEPIVIFTDKSKIVFDNKISKHYNISNIDIKLFENDEFIGKPQKIDVYEEFKLADPELKYCDTYKFDHIVKEGAKYTITADCEKFKSVEAKTQVPSTVNFSVIDTSRIEILYKEPFHEDLFTNKYLKVKIKIAENANENNKYRLKMACVGTIDKGKACSFNYDLQFTNEEGILKIQRFGENDNTSYSKVFSGQTLRNNTIDIYIPSHLLSSLPICHNLDNDSELLDADMSIHIKLENISDDYYKFANSNKQNEDSYPSPFAEPIPTYNNVKNGLGIFGSCSSPYIDSTTIFSFKVYNYKNFDQPSDSDDDSNTSN